MKKGVELAHLCCFLLLLLPRDRLQRFLQMEEKED